MFASVKATPPIEVFHVNKCYQVDSAPRKVNLSVGAYRTDEGKSWILPVVSQAERLLTTRSDHTHEYLPILGNVQFRQLAARVLFGDQYNEIESSLASVQSLGGTGAVRIGLEFAYRVGGARVAYISNPTWGNHRLILEHIGYTVKSYAYWCPVKRAVDFNAMLNDLEAAQEKSIVLLHGCAHNPTGMDLNHDQWKQLAVKLKENRLYPFLDLAYQGFATGDLDRDAWAPRYLASIGMEFSVAQSFSKNFGLYNERVGCLHVYLSNSQLLEASMSQLTTLVRATYSNPANYGAKLVEIVLSSPELTKTWKDNLTTMAERIKRMRQALRKKLEELGAPGTWNHITDQIGMFSFTGLTEKQCKYLTDEHHIYLLKNGRINMCGLNSGNIDYVATAFRDALTKF